MENKECMVKVIAAINDILETGNYCEPGLLSANCKVCITSQITTTSHLSGSSANTVPKLLELLELPIAGRAQFSMTCAPGRALFGWFWFPHESLASHFFDIHINAHLEL